MNVAVAGAGKMGAEIFRLLARSSLDVTLYARNASRAAELEKKHLKDVRRSVRRGTLSKEEAESRRCCVHVTGRLEDLAGADIVIEAISEDFDSKSALFKELEPLLREDTVIGTNSSSLSVEELALELSHPERFCGMHFFYPVSLIRMVEIISWRGASESSLDLVTEFCRAVSRKPIRVIDGPGSIVNSVLAYYYTEALYILEEGHALPSQIDSLARRFCTLGPCESADAVGIDLFVKGLQNVTAMGGLFQLQSSEESGRVLTREECAGRGGFYIPHLFAVLLEANRLGRKTSAGLYIYEDDHPVDDDACFYRDPGQTAVEKQGDDLLADRLLYAIFNGVLYGLHAAAASRKDLDDSTKEVLLMERGPFELMDGLGEERVRQDFNRLSDTVGERFRHESDWVSWR